MKKLYFFSIFLSSLLILLQSCSKQSARDMISPVSPNIINTTIAPNGNYQLSLEGVDDVNIEKQALHYVVSKTEFDAKTGKLIYRYTPVKDYTGKDEVVLSRKSFVGASAGGRCNTYSNNGSSETGYATSYITIRLNITN